MQVLIAFLAEAFTAILTWFAKYWTVKVAAFLAAAGALTLLYASIVAAIRDCIPDIAAIFPVAGPAGWMWDFAFSCMPDQMPQALACITEISAARWVYNNGRYLVDLAAKVES